VRVSSTITAAAAAAVASAAGAADAAAAEADDPAAGAAAAAAAAAAERTLLGAEAVGDAADGGGGDDSDDDALDAAFTKTDPHPSALGPAPAAATGAAEVGARTASPTRTRRPIRSSARTPAAAPAMPATGAGIASTAREPALCWGSFVEFLARVADARMLSPAAPPEPAAAAGALPGALSLPHGMQLTGLLDHDPALVLAGAAVPSPEPFLASAPGCWDGSGPADVLLARKLTLLLQSLFPRVQLPPPLHRVLGLEASSTD
jgi:hypothetical protein